LIGTPFRRVPGYRRKRTVTFELLHDAAIQRSTGALGSHVFLLALSQRGDLIEEAGAAMGEVESQLAAFELQAERLELVTGKNARRDHSIIPVELGLLTVIPALGGVYHPGGLLLRQVLGGDAAVKRLAENGVILGVAEVLFGFRELGGGYRSYLDEAAEPFELALRADQFDRTGGRGRLSL